MTGEMRQIMQDNLTNNCDKGSSVYTMAAVAGCLLLCIGIVIYALIGA